MTRGVQARRLLAASFGTALVALVAACGSSAQTPRTGVSAAAQKPAAAPNAARDVRVLASEFAFSPSTIELKAGQQVTVTFVNNGKVDHDMKSDLPISGLKYSKADNDADEQTENAARNVFDVDFSAGDTSVVTFTPTTAGTYQFFCDEPGHREAGMVGTFVVH